MVSTALKNPLLAPRMLGLGLDRTLIRWTGADRVTAALAASAELQKGVYTYRLDSLNMPAFAGDFLAAGL